MSDSVARGLAINNQNKIKNQLDIVTATISSNVLNLDLSLGKTFSVNVNANINSITFSNVPAEAVNILVYLKQDATGGRSVTFPASIKWGGTPILSTEPNYLDLVSLSTVDGGATWYGTASVGHI